jgi:hypothetical protein
MKNTRNYIQNRKNISFFTQGGFSAHIGIIVVSHPGGRHRGGEEVKAGAPGSVINEFF